MGLESLLGKKDFFLKITGVGRGKILSSFLGNCLDELFDYEQHIWPGSGMRRLRQREQLQKWYTWEEVM